MIGENEEKSSNYSITKNGRFWNQKCSQCAVAFSLLWEEYDEKMIWYQRASVKCKSNTLYFIVSWSTSPPCGHSQLYEYDIHALFHCRVCSQINFLWTWGK